MQHPKVVILGAGSLFFGRKAIWQMVHSEHLRHGTLALVDIDSQRLDQMARLARRVIDHHGVPLKLEASTDRRQVLADADFVVLSFARRNAHYRGIDCEVSAQHGVRMCSGDTIGPGGVFRTLRELPEIFDVCRDVQRLCPNAWVINYINPAAVNGIALQRYFPDLKSFALCDAQYNLRRNYAKLAGVADDDKWVVHTAGPNHFTWLLKAQYDGQDLIPRIVQAMREMADADANQQAQGGKTHAKGWLNNALAVDLYDALGVLPTVIGHTKEYVRFYQGLGTGRHAERPALKLFEWQVREQLTDKTWQRVAEYVSGQASVAEFDQEFGPDPATDVIEAMWARPEKRFFINTLNRGAIPNMAPDAFVELYCDVSMAGPRPHPVDALPRGVRGMCETVLDAHELTAQAVWEQSLPLVRRALLVDPLTSSIGDIDALIAALAHAQRDALPSWCHAAAAVAARS